MNKEYTFLSKRVKCPNCGSSRGFAPFNEVEGGYCHSCGITLFPDKHFINYHSLTKRKEVISIHHSKNKNVEKAEKPEKPGPKYIEKSVIDNLPKFENSVFSDYFGNLFGEGFIWHCENCFDVRADKYGATIFIYRDYIGNLVNMKSIPYQSNGKRDKEGFKVLFKNEIVNYPAVFGYRRDKSGDFDVFEFFSKSKGYSQCLFNEYFLNPMNIHFNYDMDIEINRETPVIVLESEKSVLIASYFFPEYIFIATGGLNGLTPEKAKALKGRKVFLCFDADTDVKSRDKDKVKMLEEQGIKTKIINLFEDYNIPPGYDIADSIEYLWKRGKLRTCETI